MSFFDTLLRLTPIPVQETEEGLARTLDYLRQHLDLRPLDEESDRAAYAKAKRRLETLKEPFEEEFRNYYEWMRMEGTINLDDSQHGFTCFAFPAGQGKASVAVRLSVSVYKALYHSSPVYQGEIDDDLARNLIGLSQTLGTLFKAEGFLYTTDPGRLIPVATNEVTALMTGQDENLIDTNTIMLAGVRESIVPMREVERAWKKDNLTVTTSGFIVLNLFLPYSGDE